MLEAGIFALVGLGIWAVTFFVLVILWTIFWKVLALWVSAREGEKIWFAIIFIFNTAGVLEIIYLFGFSKWGKDYLEKRKKALKEKKTKKSKS